MRIQSARIAAVGAYNDRRADWRMGDADDRRGYGSQDGWSQPGVVTPVPYGYGDSYQGGNTYGYGNSGYGNYNDGYGNYDNGYGNDGYGQNGWQQPPMPTPLPVPTPIDNGYNYGYNNGYNGYNPGNTWQPTPIGYNPGGGFFSDVWNGIKGGISSDVQDGLHPFTAIGNFFRNPGGVFAPYTTAIRYGHPGYALGRLVANVGVIGGLVLGGRWLIGAASGASGGASVGVGGGASGVLGKVGGFFGSIVHGIGSAIGGVFHGIGSLFSGGASVGYR